MAQLVERSLSTSLAIPGDSICRIASSMVARGPEFESPFLHQFLDLHDNRGIFFRISFLGILEEVYAATNSMNFFGHQALS